MGGFQRIWFQIASHFLVPAVEKPSVVCACVHWSSAERPISMTVTSVIVGSLLRRCWQSQRLYLGGAFLERSRRADGWIWTSFASATRKSSEMTLWLGSRSQVPEIFSRNNGPPFRDTPCENGGEGPSVTWGHFELLFKPHLLRKRRRWSYGCFDGNRVTLEGPCAKESRSVNSYAHDAIPTTGKNEMHYHRETPLIPTEGAVVTTPEAGLTASTKLVRPP